MGRVRRFLAAWVPGMINMFSVCFMHVSANQYNLMDVCFLEIDAFLTDCGLASNFYKFVS
jgi:hypothetical protein